VEREQDSLCSHWKGIVVLLERAKRSSQEYLRS
jgi:hypothetical protein